TSRRGVKVKSGRKDSSKPKENQEAERMTTRSRRQLEALAQLNNKPAASLKVEKGGDSDAEGIKSNGAKSGANADCHAPSPQDRQRRIIALAMRTGILRQRIKSGLLELNT